CVAVCIARLCVAVCIARLCVAVCIARLCVAVCIARLCVAVCIARLCVTEYISTETGQREKKFRPHRNFGDRRDTVVSARTYFYADEAKCDQHMETFLQCIEASGGSSKDGFTAIKLTALGRPQFLVGSSRHWGKARAWTWCSIIIIIIIIILAFDIALFTSGGRPKALHRTHCKVN
uniref:Uncharacterized protein n=1 Tax=Callorhinchus milii TaxID=7868 RepID=A0A4W3GGT4_CALMI